MAINILPKLNTVIPGFEKATGSASSAIRDMLAGKLTAGERGAIYNAGAERATLSGMPGSSAIGGSLFANADLRNIGVLSGQRQQQGIQDLFSMLNNYAGTVIPTAGQELQNEQFNKNLGFQQGEANRAYQLNTDAADLRAAQFNEQYGPREYSTSYSGPMPFGYKQNPPLYVTPGGRTSTNPSTLMFKYKR